MRLEARGTQGISMNRRRRWAHNFAHPVHRFAQALNENSIDGYARQDYLHARLNREA